LDAALAARARDLRAIGIRSCLSLPALRSSRRGDRHQRHAECLLLPAAREQAEAPRHPYRDADRRAGRTLPRRTGTNARKQLHPGKSVYSSALGCNAPGERIAGNPDFACLPVEKTNMPHVIMQNDRVVAINNTTQIDLQGQAASESDGHRHISGTGGQLQFVRGAYASAGGERFSCLSSTYDKHGERRSCIVLNLSPGNVVTTPGSDMMYVVPGYRMVNSKGESVAGAGKGADELSASGFSRDAASAGAAARSHPARPLTPAGGRGARHSGGIPLRRALARALRAGALQARPA
jgi:hypothetical protein